MQIHGSFHAKSSRVNDESAVLVRLGRFSMLEQPTGGGVSVFLYVCGFSQDLHPWPPRTQQGKTTDPGLEMGSAGAAKVKRSEEQRR